MDSDPYGILLSIGIDSHTSGLGADTTGAAGTVAKSARTGIGIHCTVIGIAGIGSGKGTGTCTCPRPTVSPGDYKEMHSDDRQ